MLITDKDTVSRGVIDTGIQDTLEMQMQRGKGYIQTIGREVLSQKRFFNIQVAFIFNSLLNVTCKKNHLLLLFIVYHTFILILVMEVNSKTNLLNHIPAS